jgi:ABC-type multidrug transport system fused ATPase/permease subunit
MTRSLYRFIWEVSGRDQLRLCLLTGIVVGLTMVPLELQRRIVNDAVANGATSGLATLGAIYVVVLLLQGGLKYVLNVARGRIVETVTRSLRLHIVERLGLRPHAAHDRVVDRGTVVSMLAAECEDVAGFVGESISTPFMEGGSAIAVLGYLAWVQPMIAALAVVVYLPQLIVVPRVQRRINRFARLHAMLVRRLGDRFVRDHAAAAGGGQAHGAERAADAAGRRAGFARLIDRTYTARMRVYRSKFFLTAFSNFLDALGPLVVLIAGGLLVIAGRAQVGTLVVFISGFQRIQDPWDQLVTFYRGVSIARVKYELIQRTLAAHPPHG